MSRKNTIKLTERELKNVISESVKNIISELDWKTTDDAAHKANYKYNYDMAMYKFNDFKDAARELMQMLYNSPQGEAIAERIEDILIDAKKFCARKSKQADALTQHAEDNFQKTFGKSRREMEDHINNLYDQHGWENMEDSDWRKENLSPEEIDYYDNN